MQHSSALVSPSWLYAHLQDENMVVLMSTMNVIGSGQPEDAPPGYIPGAQLFDFEHCVCDVHDPLPHTMPTTELFEKEVRKLGITRDSVIVVYDNQGIYTAPRVWWMFKTMGHQQVFVLQGGLPGWQRKGYAIAQGLTVAQNKGDFVSHYQGQLMGDVNSVLAAIDDRHSQIVDARSAGRFNATEPEPRPGLRAGHMPGALNLPFGQCVQNTELLPPEQLENLFSQLGLRRDTRLIFSCGSGVTACVLALAAHEAGYAHISVYDGSWSEWGARAELPIAVI